MNALRSIRQLPLSGKATADVGGAPPNPDVAPAALQGQRLTLLHMLRRRTEDAAASPSASTGPTPHRGVVALLRRGAVNLLRVLHGRGETGRRPTEPPAGFGEPDPGPTASPGPNPTTEAFRMLTALESAAAQGDVAAAVRLAALYRSGDLVERNLDRAMAYLRAAALAGDGDAAFDLGFICQSERSPPNPDEAKAWYELAASRGNALASFNLALMLDSDDPAARDTPRAEFFYTLAARAGLTRAQNNLGGLYFRERGLDPDFRRSFAWYSMAAAAGDPIAQYNAAILLLDGIGTERDLARARRLAEAAWRAEVPDARRVLTAIKTEMDRGSDSTAVWRATTVH